MLQIAFVLLALTTASTIAHSGECEDRFRKSGNPLSGTDFASRITLLVEQRSTGATRPIPTLITVAASGSAATIDMTVETEKVMLARQDAMRPYLCELLGRVGGGQEGLAAAAKGAQVQNVHDIQEDGEDYTVSFEIPAQLANVLTFRKGQNATFTGTFYRYDDIKRMAWLENCRQVAR